MHRLTLLTLLLPLAACPPDKGDTDSATGTTGGSTTHATDHATGPATGSTGAPADDCAFLVGKTFASDEQHECGLGPNGVELCTWTISFTASGYDHEYSDLSEAGTYTCQAGAIAGMYSDYTRAGTIDADTGKLVWEAVAYTVVP